MRIAVTGVTGQVGWELVRSLQPLGEVVALDSRALDLADPARVRAVLREVAPQVIVNPAAYTAVDKAESETGKARAINAAAPAAMAGYCVDAGALLVHYSTDYVFDGSRDGRYREDDPTAPANAYGLTKLEGEQAIRTSGCAHLILRTSWVYSLRGGNFLRTMVRLAAARDHLKIVADQYGVPTPASFIADVTAQLIARRQASAALKDWSGVLNLTPAGRTSWFEYASRGLALLHRATQAGTEGRLPATSSASPGPEWQVPRMPSLEAIPASAYPTPARRPANSCLDLSRIENVWGMSMPSWDGLLATVLRDA
ncbi:MAG: dTDP-4-dehydrorhamnose reductase [Lautropia sp.]|nr:dTDP-4-dehydrorhamnose reductase [Lautropia sp.]